MTNVLAFDFGASSGRVLLGSFDGERISYKEVHRFENIPMREDAPKSKASTLVTQDSSFLCKSESSGLKTL